MHCAYQEKVMPLAIIYFLYGQLFMIIIHLSFERHHFCLVYLKTLSFDHLEVETHELYLIHQESFSAGR